MRFHDRVSVTIAAHVAHVLLDRADKMNALDPAMFAALIDAGRVLHDLKGLRAVVLSGEGRSFCAGLDMGSMAQTDRHDRTPLTERTHGNANHAQQVAMVWRKLPVPVIAAVHGVCFGGGLQIASGADIRVVAPDARLAVMELKWGLVPDMGGYALWKGTIRDDVLRELTYTNREFSGAEAKELGFATYVDSDPLARAPLHNPAMMVDEAAMPRGVALHCAFATTSTNKLLSKSARSKLMPINAGRSMRKPSVPPDQLYILPSMANTTMLSARLSMPKNMPR